MLEILPGILEEASPSVDSPEFKSFYKFCFKYGKSGGLPGAKNVDLDIACEFLNMALDKARYQIDYRPTDLLEGAVGQGGKRAEGDFPHRHTFVEFLQKAAKLRVVNRDQWESFLPFNKGVGWGLEGYSEDMACKFLKACLANTEAY